MSQKKSRVLSERELAAFGRELDALQQRAIADVGERDARYLRKVIRVQQYLEMGGRGLLFMGIFPPAWLLGTGMLGVAKILENMEIAHNVMHGQYDFMNEPDLRGASYEWDTVGTGDNWRESHNYKHHTYTNIEGIDDDVGYSLLRLFPEQRWHAGFLFQSIAAVLLALLFQWGVAIQELQLGKLAKGRKSWSQLKQELRPLWRKSRRQLLKDYLFFPLLAGPFFLTVLSGNLVANLIRNLWTFTIIFCGHFTADAEVFPPSVLDNESRAHWYLRQLRGSSNLSGGKLFHVLSGNLSHQIEHHMFPTVPAHRYAEMSLEVREICRRYGQHYNTGSLPRQFGQVLWRIVRHSLPSRVAAQPAPLAQ